MGKQKGAAGTLATTALDRAKMSYELHAYEHDPQADSYGLEAAASLGRRPDEVFKTLIVDTGAGLAVAVVPVDRQLDLKATATALGVKRVSMAEPGVAERSSGMVVGGISPVGQRKLLPTVLDSSMRSLPTVLVSGGRRGLDVELDPDDLAHLTRAVFAPIAR